LKEAREILGVVVGVFKFGDIEGKIRCVRTVGGRRRCL